MGVRNARTSGPAGKIRADVLVLGVVVGMLTAGLLVPLEFGQQVGKRIETTAPATGRSSQLAPSSSGAGDVGSAGAGGASSGQAATAGTGTSLNGAAGAGGVTAASGTASNPATAASGPSAPAASAEPIKVGVLLLNIGNISAVGFGGGPGLSPAEQQTVWDAYIGDTNKAGGINGRPIKPTYRTYDPLSDDDMRASCLALTEDAKSFVVVDAGGFIGPPVLCVREEHRTPFILTASYGVPQEDIQHLNCRRLHFVLSADRAMLNHVSV